MTEQEYLAHYGVLGMKWGVRRNPSKAYAKAIKKQHKLDTKYVNKNLKAAKKQKKATKTLANATTSRQVVKGFKKQAKANKLNLKAAKLQKKGLNWTKKMEKEFANYDIKKVPKDTILSGKKYVYELTKRQD